MAAYKLLILFTFASVTWGSPITKLPFAIAKSPSACSSRPCTYTLTCAGATCTTLESAELQTAIDDAWRGDTITMTAGTMWVGRYYFNNRSGSAGYLTVQSSGLSSLPPDGVRVSPANAPNMPTIQGPITVLDHAVINVMEGSTPATNVKFIGLEIRPDPGMNGTIDSGNDIFRIGSNTATSLAQLTDYIEIDRCYIHGQFGGETRNAIVANAKNFTLKNSYVSEIKSTNSISETHVISTYNTPGPLIIDNNFLEAATEVVLTGGAYATITTPMLVSGSITNNYFHKPLKWFSTDPDYVGLAFVNKNMLEWKVGANWQVSGNVFDNNFKDNVAGLNDQAGHAIAFNIRMPCFSAACASWAKTDNIVFENNIIRHSLGTISALCTDSNYGYVGTTSNITIRNNLFYDISNAWQNDSAYTKTYFRSTAGCGNFVVANNTTHTADVDGAADNSAAWYFSATSGDVQLTNLTWRNNLAPGGLYGWKGDSLGIGAATVNDRTAGAVSITNSTMPGFSGNWPSSSNCTGGRVCSGLLYPSNAQWNANYQRWLKPGVTPGASSFALVPNSPYAGIGTSNTVGVDISQLSQISNVRVTPSDTTAVLEWDVTQPLTGFTCNVDVSTSRNLVSELAAWTPVNDANPALYQDANLSSRAGSWSNGLHRAFLIGAAGGSRLLTASTTYYYRAMCGGDTVQGSFVTKATQSGTRTISLAQRPQFASGVATVRVRYGDVPSGAPGSITGSISDVTCVSGLCSIAIASLPYTPQYVQLTYLASGGGTLGSLTVLIP